MTTISTPRPTRTSGVIIHEEKQTLPPPTLIVGPLAWIRNNLFKSVFDSVLTLVSVYIIISIITGMYVWVTTQANWYVVTFNLRQLMLGRYEAAAEWRVTLVVLLSFFVVGFVVASWTRAIPRIILIIVLALLLFSIFLPILINATQPAPTAYFAVGNNELVSGTAVQVPQPALAFTGQEGEVVTIRIATSYSESEEALASLNSFGDDAANILRNGAANRLAAQARIAEIDGLLAGDLLTQNQRTQLETELSRLTVDDPVIEKYQLNQSPVTIRLWRGTTSEVIVEGELSAPDAPLSVILPETGWYVLEKTTAGDGAALLETTGIYPLLLRNITRPQVGQVEQFVRMHNNFVTEEKRPRIGDDQVPFANIINNQYRGTGEFPDYLTLFLAPFLNQINIPFLIILIAIGIGYLASRMSDQIFRRETNSHPSRRMAVWLLSALPIMMFILIHGFLNILPITDTRLWGGLMLTFLLTMVGIIGSFPLGILLALGRRSSLPIIRIVCTLYIEFVRGVPLITVLFMAQLLVPFLNPALAEVDNVFRAMVAIVLFSAAYLAENVRGGLQSIPPGQEEAAKAVGLSGWQIILYITLPQALRAVIPALVGQFISLFKDTSLVAIVGLIDLTGMGEIIVTQTEFLGLRREVFIFLILIYFSFSYIMASISRRIEASGSGAARRI